MRSKDAVFGVRYFDVDLRNRVKRSSSFIHES